MTLSFSYFLYCVFGTGLVNRELVLTEVRSAADLGADETHQRVDSEVQRVGDALVPGHLAAPHVPQHAVAALPAARPTTPFHKLSDDLATVRAVVPSGVSAGSGEKMARAPSARMIAGAAAPALPASAVPSRPAVPPAPLRASAPPRAPAPTATVQAFILGSPIASAVVGGAVAGGLHGVTGPDHLAAVLPLSIARRWYRAMNTGAIWGIGHGVGAGAVGAAAYFVKGAFNLERVCTFMEAFVGLSIVIIGYNGIMEAREWTAFKTALAQTEAVSTGLFRTLTVGILHGASGSGHLLGVLPALAMPSWACASAYLVSFGVGTAIAMSAFTAVVGEASVQLGERLKTQDIPARMALFSSCVAMIVGTAWMVRASFALGLPKLLRLPFA